MSEENYKGIPGLTRALASAVIAEMVAMFKMGRAPTRAEIMSRLRENHAELVHPLVELPVALVLNHMVDHGMLERKGGKFYHPGERFLGSAQQTG